MTFLKNTDKHRVIMKCSLVVNRCNRNRIVQLFLVNRTLGDFSICLYYNEKGRSINKINLRDEDTLIRLSKIYIEKKASRYSDSSVCVGWTFMESRTIDLDLNDIFYKKIHMSFSDREKYKMAFCRKEHKKSRVRVRHQKIENPFKYISRYHNARR